MLQISRAALLLGSTLLNFLAFRYLQLDQALAIMFSTPFIVAALSGPMLGEWVGWRRWAAIGVGFLGVLAGDAADQRRHSSGGVVFPGERLLPRSLCDHDPHPLAQ